MYTETYFNSEDPTFKSNLESQILDSIDDTIDHVSAISNNLSPHILKNFGLKTAIQKFCDKIQKSSKINIDTKVIIDNRLAEEIEVTFYRVVIELVNNTIKHANASKIIIELAKNGNTIVLNYSDNGIGYKFDELMKKSKGMGLFNIKSRIESLNGELNFSSVPLEKLSLRLTVPL
ncbi:MAG: hypothetical protein HC831_08420 [Chloroflexia bacterium]|nr:hypothetical protein [Chloroflexia bacterium]